MKFTRFILIVCITLMMSGVNSYAQLDAPVQTDTLFILSMKYHYDRIRFENWPYNNVIRKADAFVFGDKEFKILNSYDRGKEKRFEVSDGNIESSLYYTQRDGKIFLKFAGYELVCSIIKPSSDYDYDFVGEEDINKLDPRAVFPVIKEGLSEEKDKNNSMGILKGRSVVGTLPTPVYKSMESGTIVVKIWVNNYGMVAKAEPGAQGTTITDKGLWKSATKSAMETRFNMSADAPSLQEGYITYIFNMK